MAASWALASLIIARTVLLCSCQGTDPIPLSTYVTQKDLDAKKTGKTKFDEFCGDGFKGDDSEAFREESRTILSDTIGRPNVIMESLKAANSSDDVSKKMEEEMNFGWFVGKVGPLVCAVLFGFAFLICCWTGCPCCKCCRCCRKKRNCSKIVKLVGTVLAAGIMAGIVVAGSVAFGGYGRARQGFDNFKCSASETLHYSLSGQTEDSFIGMLYMLDKFHELSGMLNADSVFMNDVTTSISASAEIDEAMYVAQSTLELMRDTLALNANVEPTDSSGAAMKHRCEFCSTLSTSLQPVIQGLETGAGTALQLARAEVMNHLTNPQAASDFQSMMQGAAAPLDLVKNLIRDAMVPFIEDGGDLEEATNMKDDPSIPLATSFLLVWALLIAACSMFAMLTCLVCEKTKEDRPKPTISYCSCSSWYCGCLFMIFAFIVGGLMLILAVPFSGFCLVLDGLGDNLMDIAPALNFNTSDSTVAIMHQCVAGGNKSSPNLLDIITVPDENGTLQPMRTELIGKIKDSILRQFDNAAAAMNESPTLSNDAGVLLLRNMCADNDVSMMILPVTSQITQDYDLLVGASANSGIRTAALGSSVKCAAATPQHIDGMTTSIEGVDGWRSAVMGAGKGSWNSWSCPPLASTGFSSFSCSASSAECTQLQQYTALKAGIMRSNTFRCDIFQVSSSNSANCDVKDMNKVGGVWLGSCSTNRNHVRKARTCTLAQFEQYLRDYDVRLQKIFQRVDDAVQATNVEITMGIKNAVTTHIFSLIDAIADGMGCGFLYRIFRKLIDGLCFQGVVGIVLISRAYVACACLALAMVVLMYIVWRIAFDNFDRRKHEVEDIQVLS